MRTVVCAAVTSNTRLARMPGNVFLPAGSGGLPKDGVVNVTQLVTLNRWELVDLVGELGLALVRQVCAGLQLVVAPP